MLFIVFTLEVGSMESVDCFSLFYRFVFVVEFLCSAPFPCFSKIPDAMIFELVFPMSLQLSIRASLARGRLCEALGGPVFFFFFPFLFFKCRPPSFPLRPVASTVTLSSFFRSFRPAIRPPPLLCEETPVFPFSFFFPPAVRKLVAGFSAVVRCLFFLFPVSPNITI